MSSSLPILDLGADFFSPVSGGPFLNPKLRYRNQKQAAFLGLDKKNTLEWLEHFGGFKPIENNLSNPFAMKYHGHQFQSYNPGIGDGRGFVFAQFLKNKHLFELGTKGSGKTPFSRRGDGRLTLKGAIRELLATDYLETQRVLTSKTFTIIETDEKLERHDEPSPTRSAVLYRLSRGHIRIGNFQYAYYHQNRENIFKLIDYSMKNFYPFVSIPEPPKQKVECFFENVTRRLADLCASYMVAGFVHGVLNTDNINVSGESFDYGPYRFLPHYDPYFTAAYFDHEGLYSFGRQPPSFLWNLNQLNQCLLWAAPEADLKKIEDSFAIYFNVYFSARFLKKLNLMPAEKSESLLDFLNLSPDYYDDFEFPVLDKNQLDFPRISEISNSSFFKKIQSAIDLFFKDLHEQPSKTFETAFLEIVEWIQSAKQATYFSSETLKFLSENFVPIKKLAENQIQLRRQTLLIDEIEKIWTEIADNDNWRPLYDRISNP